MTVAELQNLIGEGAGQYELQLRADTAGQPFAVATITIDVTTSTLTLGPPAAPTPLARR